MIIPAKNAQELTDEQLEQVAGGQQIGTPMDFGDICMAYGVPIYELKPVSAAGQKRLLSTSRNSAVAGIKSAGRRNGC